MTTSSGGCPVLVDLAALISSLLPSHWHYIMPNEKYFCPDFVLRLHRGHVCFLTARERQPRQSTELQSRNLSMNVSSSGQPVRKYPKGVHENPTWGLATSHSGIGRTTKGSNNCHIFNHDQWSTDSELNADPQSNKSRVPRSILLLSFCHSAKQIHKRSRSPCAYHKIVQQFDMRSAGIIEDCTHAPAWG